MEYTEREKLKEEGWRYFSSAKTAEGKVQALMHFIIPSHYWRAREHLENRKDYKRCLKLLRGPKYYSGYELDIDHYTENWIYSQLSRDFMKNGVLESCIEWYDPIQCKYLPEGMSIYQIPVKES